MSCPVCASRPAEIGVLCEECRDDLAGPLTISQEQIVGWVAATTRAALVDLWGRPHELDPVATVGRQVDARGIAVLDPSVSRVHATLTLDAGLWSVRDLGSANGTYVEDRPIAEPAPLRHGDRIRFGHVAFYLVADVAALPPAKATRAITTTIPQFTSPRARTDAGMASDEFAEQSTDVGLPELRFRLHEPAGGGGGVIEVDGKQAQLTPTQLRLMALMIDRMTAEADHPELVRGFVRSAELIADLPWDTLEPSDNHVKQLVRRVRRALVRSQIGDLIESRHRFGYRLRAIPKSG